MNDVVPENFTDNPTLYKGTYLEFLGFRLIDWREGFVRMEMQVRPDHRNSVAYLHGGVISSLLDVAGAVSGSFGVSGEYVAVTVNLNCAFMAPHQGDVVIAEGELIRRTSSMFFAQSRLLDPSKNMLCATATGTYKKQQRDSAVPVG